MTPEQPNDAEVQRMLALKRHEQPPPAFFQGFSEKVIDRIQSAGPAQTLTWRERLSVEFYGVPIYICAAGVVVFGLLILGIIGSFRVDPPVPHSASGPASEVMGTEPSHAIVPPQPQPPQAQPRLAPGTTPLPVERGGQPTRATLVTPESVNGGK